MKIDILKNELYITAFRRILRNYVPHKKIIHTEGRAWDALILVLGGSCRYHFDDGAEFTAQAGDLFYLAKGSVYEMDVSHERYEVIFIDFLFGGEELRKSALLSSQNAERERVFRGEPCSPRKTQSVNVFFDGSITCTRQKTRAISAAVSPIFTAFTPI